MEQKAQFFCSEKMQSGVEPMQRKKRKLFVSVCPPAACAILFFLWCGMGWMLPEKLTLTEGQSLRLETALPISAKTEESVGVVGIRTEPLADSTHLSLGSCITAESKQAGSTPVTFYLCDALPLKTVQAQVLPQRALVPVGKTVGVTMDTDGLLVLGTGYVSGTDRETYAPSEGVLQMGDLILTADGTPPENKEEFLQIIEGSGGKPVTLRFLRDGTEREATVTPVFSAADRAYKIGVWIRDSIQGIGTVTYYDPADGTFGALGHGVYDMDTGGLMQIREGALAASSVAEVVRGKKGDPGELTGTVDLQRKLARVQKNTETGIYGVANGTEFDGEALPIAAAEEVKQGEAVLLSDLEGGAVRAYTLEIESIRQNGAKDNKDMTIRITDERLLKLTGGIVQGMSGSPIVQDGKLIGAVTYVLVNEPARGYGILIENMLEQAG